jgi:uncharacterized protein YkwD
MNKNTRFYLTLVLAIVLLVLLTAYLMNIWSAKQTIVNRTPTTTSSVQPNPTSSPSGNNVNNGQTTNISQEGQAANAVFKQINAARAQANLPALQWSNLLVNSAHKHNLTMIAYNQLAHQLPNEPDLGTRVSQAGVNWMFVAENIGESSDYLHPINAAVSLNQAMLNEKPPDDGHRQNILSSDATIIGIDVLIDTRNQRTWLTEDFARPA